MSPRARWIAAILGLLGANVLGVGILIAASSARAAQIIPAYDDRAARFDVAIDEAEASRALAWRVSLSATRSSIAASVSDRDGRALSDARVRVEGFHRAHAAATLDLPLAPVQGRYGVTTALLPGVYDLRVTVERGRDRYVEPMVVEVQ